MADVNNIETDLAKILLTPHGLQRRKERNVALREIESAIKKGEREPAEMIGPNGERRWKYSFKGVVAITDDESKRVISTWTLPAIGVDVEKVVITPAMEEEHSRAVERLENMASWTSHTVVVVDQSGSMRKNDATEGMTRSDLVWVTIALSFIADKLRKGERKATDVFSLISMKKESNVLLWYQPFDWILYNKVVDLLRSEQPLGAGNYFPCLKTAQMLLNKNRFGSCALMLMFLSDGKPSDQFKKGEAPVAETQCAKIRAWIAKIACRIGARLTVGAIALGKSNDDFVTLKALMDEAKKYGCRGFFQPASLSATVLSKTMTSLTTTLTATMVEMTDTHDKRQRQCRRFRKEPISNVGGIELTDDFDKVVQREWTVQGTNRFSVAEQYRAALVRMRYLPGRGWIKKRDVFNSEKAVGVAIKKAWFGEGAERLVKEFREVDKHNKFVGPPLVAKDTKYLQKDIEGNDDQKKDFHKVFLKTQLKAQKYARLFNRKLLQLPHIDEDTTPQIEFLDCSIYMIEPKNEERQAYLVERMLDIKKFQYRKWNDNAGRVGNTLAEDNENDEKPLGAFGMMEALVEEDEEELSSDESSAAEASTDDDDDDSDEENNFMGTLGGRNKDTAFTLAEIPQAFSCFSYHMSKRRFLICDLQGVLNTSKRPPLFEFTDPVIHHRDSTDLETKYGRSDKGLAGMDKFFETHQCSNLCRMMQRRFFAELPAEDQTNDNISV